MKNNRTQFTGLMLCAAMLVLIESHVVNALIDSSLRSSTWFYVLNFANGLAAPSIIFIAGFVFMPGIQTGNGSSGRGTRGFMRQAGIIMLMWVCGYLLHIPFFSLDKCMHRSNWVHWIRFQSVDLLQLIALGLMIILLLRFIIKNERLFTAMVAALGLMAVVPAPYIYSIDSEKLAPFWLAAYMAPVYFSYFPVFPWFGFMAAGAISAMIFRVYGAGNRENVFMKRALIAGAAAAAISIPLMFYMKGTLKIFTDIRPNILFFTGRLACLYIILALCYYCSRPQHRILRIFTWGGSETLLVYILHLQIIHRDILPGGLSLSEKFPNTLGPAMCILIALSIILLMLPAAFIWNMLREKYRYFTVAAVTAMVAAGAILFVLL